MIPAEQLIAKLQHDLSRKTHSFAEYVTLSSPYVPKGAEKMWKLVMRQARNEHDHAEKLAEMIAALGGVPEPGLFDIAAADTNYLSIVYLYGQLIREKKKTIGELEQRMKDAHGYPRVQQLVGRLVEEDRRMLRELEEAQQH